ncbi:MAG: site-2 protease family protein [Methanobacteriota archaeon]|nr:MAG: site-2 protease family protein [Euryarchaeota archaeon]
MLSAEAEVESIRSLVVKHFDVYGVIVTPLALTFQVRVPPTGIDAPFDGLRQELVPKDYIPTITQEKGETLVHVQRRPKARFAGVRVNVILLILTILTIVFFGGAWNWADYSGKPILSAESIGYGALFFSLPLFAILGCHEMGHYVVAKRYHVRASLPFFLPSVPPLGTLGAFISMRDPIPNRRALLDIGVSGPLVGFAIAIPVTLAGLALSAASPAVSPTAVGEAIRPSILFSLLSLFFPVPSSFALHPLAFAGWVGLFVTAINLLPAGQLDGGHVARALLGRRQFYVSWAAVLILFGMSVFYPGWFIFGFLIFMLGVRHPPPLNDLTRLDPGRKLVGIVAVAILIVTFVPQPFASAGTQRGLAFEAVTGFPFPINATIVLASSIHLMFALNNTGPASENVVVNLRQNNLNEFGFVIRFTAFRIGTATTPVSTDTLTFRLNAVQRAVLDLNVTAPSSWGTSSLPATVTFEVHATTPDGAAQQDLVIMLQITS